jgi:hypothetical protein
MELSTIRNRIDVPSNQIVGKYSTYYTGATSSRSKSMYEYSAKSLRLSPPARYQSIKERWKKGEYEDLFA